jgi:L-arabinose isomerase
MKNTTKIGLFGVGLDTYWPQFKGLQERLVGYQQEITGQLKDFGADIVDRLG